MLLAAYLLLAEEPSLLSVGFRSEGLKVLNAHCVSALVVNLNRDINLEAMDIFSRPTVGIVHFAIEPESTIHPIATLGKAFCAIEFNAASIWVKLALSRETLKRLFDISREWVEEFAKVISFLHRDQGWRELHDS